MLCFDKIKCCTKQYQIDTVLYLFTSINKINQSRDPCNVVWMYDTDSVKLLCHLQVLVSSLGTGTCILRWDTGDKKNTDWHIL